MKVILNKLKALFNIITCRHCESKVRCKKEEMEYVSDFRDGDFYWFNCPVCKEKTAIDARLVK